MTYCYSKREGETLNLDGVEETFTYLHTFDGLLLWKASTGIFCGRGTECLGVGRLRETEMGRL